MICRNVEAVVAPPKPFAAFPAEGRGEACLRLQPVRKGDGCEKRWRSIQSVNTRRGAEARQEVGR